MVVAGVAVVVFVVVVVVVVAVFVFFVVVFVVVVVVAVAVVSLFHQDWDPGPDCSLIFLQLGHFIVGSRVSPQSGAYFNTGLGEAGCAGEGLELVCESFNRGKGR